MRSLAKSCDLEFQGYLLRLHIRLSTHQQLARLDMAALSAALPLLTFSSAIQNLDITLQLTFSTHINLLSRDCFYQLRLTPTPHCHSHLQLPPLYMPLLQTGLTTAPRSMLASLPVDWDVLDLDLGVDPNKSTWVDLRTSSRVGSVLPGAVDSKSNLELKSDFTASRFEIDLNWLLRKVPLIKGSLICYLAYIYLLVPYGT